MRFTPEERELIRQKVLFYVWERYLTSNQLITPNSIAEGLKVPKRSVVAVLKHEHLFRNISHHNNLLRKKQLKGFH